MIHRGKNFIAGVGLLSLLLVGCGNSDGLPTSAPRIPTQTFTPTATATRVFVIVSPPPTQAAPPSWTPLPSDTPAPTRTLAPSLTPRPSATPRLQPTPGIEQLENGVIRLTTSADEINLALSSQTNTPQFSFAPDVMLITLEIPNTFLNENSIVEARVTPTLNGEGFSLSLDSYTSTGPSITRADVRNAFQNLAPALNAYLKTQAGDVTEFLHYEMAFDFLIVEMQ